MAAAWQSFDVIAALGRRIDNMDGGFWIRIQDHRLRTSIEDQDHTIKENTGKGLCLTFRIGTGSFSPEFIIIWNIFPIIF